MTILDYLKENILVLDGGLGTELQKAGLKPGESTESWNITHPEEVTKIHRNYFEAGSNVVNTNTFGANALKYSDTELEAIVKSAVENAKKARETANSNKEMFISLDIGPTGKLLKPYGDLSFGNALEIFKKTVILGVKYGVDLISVETFNDCYETKAALLAVKEACDLPVFVSNAYSSNDKLLSGADASAMTAMLEGLGADAVGTNCSFGPKELKNVVNELLAEASVPVILKPNAGIPRTENGKTVFDVTPEEFSLEIKEQVKNGVRIVGGCCGTTPEYIKAVCEKIKDLSPVPIKPKNKTVVSSYTHTVSFGKKPVLIGERINPTGKKKFKEALRNNNMSFILNEGITQQEKGVDILDVNVGLPEIDESKMLSDTVFQLQAVSDLPLQIDTSDFNAMEQALRIYNGKPLINSVNGKKESMDNIFPLMKKYGGVAVALTLDETGIPETADGRIKIAEKIIKEAEKYGIDKKDLIFDPLALTVSTDKFSPGVTLKTVKKITEELGCNTSLGVSNVSFGLPGRDFLNSSFFTSALENGLNAAIMNPFSQEMMKAYYSFCALHGFDDNFTEFIKFTETAVSDKPAVTVTENASTDLQSAIIKGLKDSAAEITRELLKTTAPLDIINKEIIPALDVVGKGFENKTVYLPSLLMSAESAKEAFEVIKSLNTEKNKESTKCIIVLATVQNDIHDIGKNIVKLLLENYGFNVTDLGKDVPPEVIVDEVIKRNAPIAGLSALMTTTVPSMEKTIKLLKEKAPFCKTIVGGAVLTKEYADSIKADFYAKDAMETVRIAESIDKQI